MCQVQEPGTARRFLALVASIWDGDSLAPPPALAPDAPIDWRCQRATGGESGRAPSSRRFGDHELSIADWRLNGHRLHLGLPAGSATQVGAASSQPERSTRPHEWPLNYEIQVQAKNSAGLLALVWTATSGNHATRQTRPPVASGNRQLSGHPHRRRLDLGCDRLGHRLGGGHARKPGSLPPRMALATNFAGHHAALSLV